MSPTPRIVILIGPYQFTVRAPFTAGHMLTQAEASAYNEFRAKGVVWNMRGAVGARAEGMEDGELLDDATLRELQSQIDTFDAGYRHPVERGSRANKRIEPKRGVIEAEAYAIAGRELDEFIRREGIRMHPEDYERQREFNASRPELRAKARTSLRQKRRVIAREGIE